MADILFWKKARRILAWAIPLVAGSLVLVAAAPFSLQQPDWDRYFVLAPAGPQEPSPEFFRKLNRLVYAKHKLGANEKSAGLLAQEFGTNPMSLQATNNDELLVLRTGEVITVLNKEGQLYRVRKGGETLDRIVAKYYRNKREAQQFKESIVKANALPGSALLGSYEIPEGAHLLLPKIKVYFDTYRYPFQGWGWGRISSGFGLRYHPILHRYRFHDGFDIPKPWGTPVYPSRSGVVVSAGWMEGYGLLIIIKHADGATTRYGHLSRMYVKPGQQVQRGKTLIGRVGSTGLSTGPHLHFEVRDKNGHPVNPASKIGRR